MALAGSLVIQLSMAQAPPGTPSGEVIERLVCADNPNQSYALYLPSSYTTDKSWPIVMALDPGARGKIPVKHFREAAEKYGWIIAASNNSRNGPIELSVEAINAIWKDARARFSINSRRVYFAGFSGAARAAITIANACNHCTAGLITGGAGFPQRFAPSKTTPAAFYTTVGVDDFNFPEVKEVDDVLTKAGIDHLVRVFAGTHEWAPSFILVEAVEWLELNGMKTGRRAKDAKLIDELWEKSLTNARTLEKSQNMYEAVLAYQSMRATFHSLRDLTDAQTKVDELQNLPAVKQAIRDERDQIRKQLSLQQEIWNLIEQSSRPVTPANVGAGNSENSRTLDREPLNPEVRLLGILADLKKQSTANEDSGKRRVARRVLEGVNIGLIERGFSFLESRKLYADAVSTFQLLTEMNPEQPGGFYYLAWGHAAAGNQKKALESLRLAVEKGFANLKALNENKAFDALRNDPAYAAIVKTIEIKR